VPPSRRRQFAKVDRADREDRAEPAQTSKSSDSDKSRNSSKAGMSGNSGKPSELNAGPFRSPRLGRFALIALAAVVATGAGIYGLSQVRQAESRRQLLRASLDDQPESAEALRQFIASHPDDAEAIETLVAWHLRTKAPFAQFEPFLSRLCQLREDDLDPRRTRTALLAMNGRPEEAVEAGLAILERESDDHATRRLVAAAAAEAGQVDIAVREARKLYESSIWPPRESATLLVKAYLLAGDPTAAQTVLEKTFPRSEGSEDGQALWAQVMQAADKHKEAASLLEPLAAKPGPYREFALFRLGQSYAALGRDADARRAAETLESLKAAARIVIDARQRPDDLPSQLRAAEQLLGDGKPSEAAALVEQAITRLGPDPRLARLLAQAYRQLGRADLAEAWERR
jgi:predicted Zn-dependent protease